MPSSAFFVIVHLLAERTKFYTSLDGKVSTISNCVSTLPMLILIRITSSYIYLIIVLKCIVSAVLKLKNTITSVHIG